MGGDRVETALATIEKITGAELFKPGAIDPILDRIKAEVRATPRDISTEGGRKAVASLAFKVAKSKTFLDAIGKSEVEADKKRIKMIDQERSRIWDELESLQKEARKPLTDWEDAEKARIASHERELAAIAELGIVRERLSAAACDQRILAMDAAYDRGWQEFDVRAKAAREITYCALIDAKVKAQRVEAEQAELQRLRAEAAEREQQERDERIAREAREKAQREAAEREERLHREAQEREAKAIAEAKAREEAAAKQSAEQERLAKEREERIVAEAAEAKRKADLRERMLIQQAEQDRLAAIARDKRAEEARIAAEAKAESERVAAVEAERKRVADEHKRDADALAKREKDADNRRAVNKAAVEVLLTAGLSETQAKAIVTMIAKGEVPAVRIVY